MIARRPAGGTNKPPSHPQIDALLEHSRWVRLWELLVRPPDEALYHIPNRNGVSVVALRTSSLSQEQLHKLLAFRLAQYLLSGLADAHALDARQLERELADEATPDDVHILAGAAGSGEILCCAALRSVGVAAPGTTLRSADRPRFPCEQAFGRGIFDQLPILPDLPIQRIREPDAFLKNQHLSPWNHLVARAPIEVGAAVSRLLGGPLATEVAACIGDTEDGVATNNFDYFQLPLTLLRGVRPNVPPQSPFRSMYHDRPRLPFALLVADLDSVLPRLVSIEQALALPGKAGLRALLGLRLSARGVSSTLARRAEIVRAA